MLLNTNLRAGEEKAKKCYWRERCTYLQDKKEREEQKKQKQQKVVMEVENQILMYSNGPPQTWR